MSWNVSISGHREFPEATRKVDAERMEALVVAEIDALLPEIQSRLKGHGLSVVIFRGNSVNKIFDLQAG